MLEKLIANLKESLPEPLRKKLGIEDNTHEEEQVEEHSEKNSDEQSNEESDEGTGEGSKESQGTSDSEAEKKKKQISMIIRVAVILGLAYLAVDQFVLKNDNPDSEIANIPTPPRKSRKKPEVAPAEATPTEVAPAETAPTEVASAEIAPTEATPAAAIQPEEVKTEITPEVPPEENAPVENITIADKKIEEITPIPAEPVAQATGEVKSNDTQVDKSIDSLIDSVGESEKIGNEATPKIETRLQDKIVADDVYTPPPQYDQLGRGLVYNCKEKYWACVDKISYVDCNKNMKWNKAHGKPVECVVQNVYNSDDDCGIVQKYNISTSKSTSFCQE